MTRCAIENMLALLLVVFATACGMADTDLVPMKSEQELDLLAECREASDVAMMTHKYAVCHTPPGGSREPYTMLLSAAARELHLAHGDTAGGCDCDDVSSAPNAVGRAPEPSEEAYEGGTGYCDANQYRCEHNWGCPDQHVCDLGCCVYVISWAESVGNQDEEDPDETEGETSDAPTSEEE